MEAIAIKKDDFAQNKNNIRKSIQTCLDIVNEERRKKNKKEISLNDVKVVDGVIVDKQFLIEQPKLDNAPSEKDYKKMQSGIDKSVESMYRKKKQYEEAKRECRDEYIKNKTARGVDTDDVIDAAIKDIIGVQKNVNAKESNFSDVLSEGNLSTSSMQELIKENQEKIKSNRTEKLGHQLGMAGGALGNSFWNMAMNVLLSPSQEYKPLRELLEFAKAAMILLVKTALYCGSAHKDAKENLKYIEGELKEMQRNIKESEKVTPEAQENTVKARKVKVEQDASSMVYPNEKEVIKETNREYKERLKEIHEKTPHVKVKQDVNTLVFEPQKSLREDISHALKGAKRKGINVIEECAEEIQGNIEFVKNLTNNRKNPPPHTKDDTNRD